MSPHSDFRIRCAAITSRQAVIVAVFTLVGAVLGFVYGAGIPDMWRVKAQLLVNYLPPLASMSEEDYELQLAEVEDNSERADQQSDGTRGPITQVEARKRMELFVNSEVELLKSAFMIRKVVDSLVADEPGFLDETLGDRDGFAYWFEGLFAALDPTEVGDKPARCVAKWMDRLDVKRMTNAHAIQLDCISPDIELTRRFLDRLVEVYLEVHLENFSQEFLLGPAEEALTEARARSEAAHAALNEFKARHQVKNVREMRLELAATLVMAGQRARGLAARVGALEASLAELPEAGRPRRVSAPVGRYLETLRALASIEAYHALGSDPVDPARAEAASAWQRDLEQLVAEVRVDTRERPGSPGDRAADDSVQRAAFAIESRVVAAQQARLRAEIRSIAALEPEYREREVEQFAADGLLAIEAEELSTEQMASTLTRSKRLTMSVIAPPDAELAPLRSLGVSRQVVTTIGFAFFGLALSTLAFLFRSAFAERMLPIQPVPSDRSPAPRGLSARFEVWLRAFPWMVLVAFLVYTAPTLFSRESVVAPPVVRNHFAKGVLAASVGLLGLWMLRKRWLPRLNLPMVLAISYVAWCAGSGVWAVHEDGYQNQIKKLLYGFTACVAIYAAIRTRRDLEVAMLAWKATSLLFCAIICVELWHPGWRWAGRLDGGLIEVSIGQEHLHRATGPVGHPNWVGFFLGASVLLGPYFWVRYRSWFARSLLVLTTMGEVYGLIEANVRLGAAGFLLGSFYMVLRGVFPYRGRALFLMLLAGLCAWPVLPDKWKRRSATLEVILNDRSVRKRVSQQMEGIRLAAKHAGVGVGYGGFGYTFFHEASGFAVQTLFDSAIVGKEVGEFPIRNIGSHNAYIEIAIEAGAVGMLLFLLLGLVLYLGLATGVHRNKGDPKMRVLGIVLEAILLSLAVMLIVLHAQERRTLWLFVGVAAAYISLNQHGLLARDTERVRTE